MTERNDVWWKVWHVVMDEFSEGDEATVDIVVDRLQEALLLATGT